MANYPYMNYQQPPYQNYIQPTYPVAGWGQQQVQTVQAQTSTVAPVSGQTGFVCRPVASMDEGKAVPTDFSGNIIVMPDFPHNAIYTKVLNPATGSAQFDTFVKASDETEKEQAEIEYAVADDVNRAISDLRKEIKELRYDFENTTYEEVKRVSPKKNGKAAKEE